jgi:recombination protein RecT
MAEQKSLQLYIRSGSVQGSIEQTLKDRADDFTTSLLTVINGNPVLQECDPQEVVRTALKAASMRLPIDPNLGLAYIIPYRNTIKTKEKYTDSKGLIRYRWNEVKKYEPQLQIGWKGFVQLALRTQQYLTMNVTDVKEGEYHGQNRLTGAIDFAWVDDQLERDKLPVGGYVAYFKLTNGFEKILFMTTDELEAHARQYSKSYANGSGKWKDDKPNMSKKTVVKLLISKWGPQSTELQKALRADQAAMAGEDEYNYVDNDKGKRGDADQTPTESDANGAPTSPIDGEVVEPPHQSDVDQTPHQPTEAESSQVPPARQKSVKEKAAEWTAKGKASNAREKGEGNGK